MKRREFVNWVGLGLLASSLPVAIAACRSSDTASTADGEAATPADADSDLRSDGFAAIGTVAELDESGSISKQNVQGEQVAVIRNPADQASVLAVSSLCTHQGCTIEWNSGTSGFVCPCHGSVFAPDGSVVEGPASTPLATFAAKIEEDWVLVKTS